MTNTKEFYSRTRLNVRPSQAGADHHANGKRSKLRLCRSSLIDSSLRIREREVRNETPSPNPQVSGGLGLGYMATSHACLIPGVSATEVARNGGAARVPCRSLLERR